jgi:endoglucanase
MKTPRGSRLLCFALIIGLSSFASIAQANCLSPARLTGVNIAGAEFNSKNLPGVHDKDYTYPNDAELRFVAAQGANVIRLPFRWERLQPKINDPFDERELNRLLATVNNAQAKGLCVILDLHNYARYFDDELGDNPHLQDAFVAVWLELAKVFNDPEKTAFGLMNEPIHMPLRDWTLLAKRTLTALRKKDAKNLVFVGGGGWNGLHSWFSASDGHSNADSLSGLKDPLKRTVIEVHQYADPNSSGTGNECRPPASFDEMFAKISDWAEAQGLQLFLGEFGTPASPDCLATLEHFLTLMQGPTWKGWSYWAAGRWWGGYSLALNTSTTNPSPQWTPLKNHFYRTGSEDSPPNSPEPVNR